MMAALFAIDPFDVPGAIPFFQLNDFEITPLILKSPAVTGQEKARLSRSSGNYLRYHCTICLSEHWFLFFQTDVSA